MPTPSAGVIPEPSRILVRGVNWLGDAVMTAPALQRLREKFPSAHITLLTEGKLESLWLRHPSINELVPFSKKQGPFSIAAQLKPRGFDVALVFPNSPRSALEVWLAGIPERVGYSRRWRTWFLNRSVPARPGIGLMRKRPVNEIRALMGNLAAGPSAQALALRKAQESAHHIHNYLNLVAALGAEPKLIKPRFDVFPEELQAVQAAYPEFSILTPKSAQSGPPVLIGLNPSAAYGPAKRWPAENFAAVAAEINRQCPNCLWVTFGQDQDRERAEEIARLARLTMLNLAGKTSLRQLMVWLKLCRVLLTNDSGPMHLAAALGTRVVVPFGSTSPELTGPGLPGEKGHFLLTSKVACSPCFRRSCPIDLRCMHAITVGQVTEAVLQAISQPG